MRKVWTARRDAALKRFEAKGLSASRIAGRMGTTRGAVIGRSNRLRGKVFPSQLALQRLLRAQAAARRKQREQRQRVAIRKMKRALARGINRFRAVVVAHNAGATYAAIGDALGVSKQRIHQIATG